MGRRSKGPRQLVAAARLPHEFHDLIEREVDRLGCSKNDFVTHALAVVMNLPQFDPLQQETGQEQLHMTA